MDVEQVWLHSGQRCVIIIHSSSSVSCPNNYQEKAYREGLKEGGIDTKNSEREEEDILKKGQNKRGWKRSIKE